MKKISLILIGAFATIYCFAQQKEGKVIYERTIQMQIQINDNDAMAPELPRTRVDKFELLFGNNQSLWHIVDEQRPEDDNGGGGRIMIKMIGGGVDDINFYDLGSSTSVEQTEMFDKKFIINDSIKKLNWKLTGETKSILNHACQKASAQRIGTRMSMNMENGKMERKEMPDTSLVIAWFTPDIPVAAGPDQYQAQLPGLILEMDINNGRQVFKATGIEAKADIALIKAPKNGKKVTRAEFRKEADKMMDEMRRNNEGGGGRSIRINN